MNYNIPLHHTIHQILDICVPNMFRILVDIKPFSFCLEKSENQANFVEKLAAVTAIS